MSDKPRITLTVHESTRTRHGERSIISFRAKGEEIPGVLQLPAASTAACALLLHGYSSRKETMADSIGAALIERGVASLAIDLPMHGGRPVAPTGRTALELIKHWRTAQTEARLALRFLEAHSRIERARIALVGYSLGSFLSLAVCGDEPGVRAVVLAAGGDLPDNLPFAAFARTVIDPRRMVRRLDARPLLMVHGKRDRTVTPQQAKRLFEAAPEPKEIHWYDAGHVLPASAAARAAEWLAEHLADPYISSAGVPNS